MNKKMALGKGLASLLSSPTMPVDTIDKKIENKLSNKMATIEEKEGVALVDIDKIQVNPFQPRKVFDQTDLLELSQSIKENGIIQPLIVTKNEKGLELIAGERRLRAAKMANLIKIPVIIKRTTDREKLVHAIIENVQRSDLNCVEEAMAYYQLMDEFKLTQEEVAKKIGKERSTIANFLRILKLPRKILSYLQNRQLSFGHGKILVGLKDAELQDKLASECIEKKLAVRELEELVVKLDTEKVRKEKSENLHGKESNGKWESVRQNLERRYQTKIIIKSRDGNKGEICFSFDSLEDFNKLYDVFSGTQL